jgi:hypothetical protein
MRPVPEFKLRPTGSAPTDTLNAGEVQFAVESACEYGVPATPPARVVLVMTQELLAMAMLNGLDALPLEPATPMVKLNGDPAEVVGVPEMTPVPASKARPPGSAPPETLNEGDPHWLVATACEYGAPITPPGSVVVVMEQAVSGFKVSAPITQSCTFEPQTLVT